MTGHGAAQALREVVDDVQALRVIAIDSPAYRHGAHDALAAVVDLLERRAKGVVHEISCCFPECPRIADPVTGKCGRHERVQISTSYVDDRHTEGGHG